MITMPEMRNYTVIQTREVRVTANHAEDAVRIGAAAFKNGQNLDSGVIDGPEGVWGNTTSRVRQIEIIAKEKR